ncbi:MAG: SufD family Fe-S cluster assembly protein, partial [Exiguobacterium sp.]|nr:SufD family Fe-S cluster assembly protein [Exiguobacterium sp.]
MTVQFELDAQALSARAEALGGPAWMVNRRKEAAELAPTLALPKVEKIKIDKWDFTAGDVELEQKDGLTEDIESLLGDHRTNVLVERNGHVVYNELSMPEGVLFMGIKEAMEQHPELVEKYFMTEGVRVDEERLSALNAALTNGGAFIYVPKNTQLKDPLQAIFTMEQANGALYHHTILVADEGSEVTYIENFLSGTNEPHTVNVVTEVFAGENAKVVFGGVDQLAESALTFMNRRGVVYANGRLDWALGHMNDGNSVVETKTHLVGDNTYSDTKAVTIGRGAQKQNFNIRTDHFGKASEGFILIHGVQKDAATAIFSGTSMIHHGASKSNGVQTERVLMLSEKARGDANPILLIDEDDVMARSEER